MANIEVGLLETEKQLSSMIESSGKTVPKPGERANIVEHLDYMIELLGTMVSDETFKAAKKKMANGYNAINDRVEIINWLLASGEISGDVDLEPLTVSENGEYMPGAGKGYSRVVVETPEVVDNSRGIIERTLTNIYNSEATSIGNFAFYYCSSLTTASFPACTTIGNSAFCNCSSLTTASFPACTAIGNYAFYNCSSLTTASFPACTAIGERAFCNCSSLTTASFPACTTIGDAAFFSCAALSIISLPNCTYIHSNAFDYCIGLETIYLPVCSYIDFAAFALCSKLKTIYLLSDSICSIASERVFESTPLRYGSGGTIYVPSSLVDQYKTNNTWRTFSNYITAYVEP